MRFVCVHETSRSQRCIYLGVRDFIEMKIVRESPTFGCDPQEDDIVHKSSAFRRKNPYINEVIGELSALGNVLECIRHWRTERNRSIRNLNTGESDIILVLAEGLVWNPRSRNRHPEHCRLKLTKTHKRPANWGTILLMSTRSRAWAEGELWVSRG
jgi:hypothetical protein